MCSGCVLIVTTLIRNEASSQNTHVRLHILRHGSNLYRNPERDARQWRLAMEPDMRTSSIFRVLALSANLRSIPVMFVRPLLTRIDPNWVQSTSVSFFLWETPLERNSRNTEKRPRCSYRLSHRTRLTLADEILVIFVKQLKYSLSEMMNPRSRKSTIN